MLPKSVEGRNAAFEAAKVYSILCFRGGRDRADTRPALASGSAPGSPGLASGWAFGSGVPLLGALGFAAREAQLWLLKFTSHFGRFRLFFFLF